MSTNTPASLSSLWWWCPFLHLSRRYCVAFHLTQHFDMEPPFIQLIWDESKVHMMHTCICQHTLFPNRAHTHILGLSQRGWAAVLFHCISFCFMQPLPHQACLVLLRQEICSPALLLQNSVHVCVFASVCVCAFAVRSNSSPPTYRLLCAWHAWISGFNCLLWNQKHSLSSSPINDVSDSPHQHVVSRCFLMTTNQRNRSFFPRTFLIGRDMISQEVHATAAQVGNAGASRALATFCRTAGVWVCVLVRPGRVGLFSRDMWRTWDLHSYFCTGTLVNMQVRPVNFSRFDFK